MYEYAGILNLFSSLKYRVVTPGSCVPRCTRFTSRSEAGSSLKLSLPSLDHQFSSSSSASSPSPGGGLFTPTRARGTKSPFPFGESKTPSPSRDEEESSPPSGFYPRLRNFGGGGGGGGSPRTVTPIPGKGRVSPKLPESPAIVEHSGVLMADDASPVQAAVGVATATASSDHSPWSVQLADSSGSDNDSGECLKYRYISSV